MAQRDIPALVDAARAGDRGATARLLSLVERGGEGAHEVGRVCFALGGSAYTVGMTGAPGAGKSTLTSALVTRLRRTGGPRVGVLAVDPSSPFTGGALLGDRVRMGDHVLDPDVFIRSMATRGHLGGLALATPEAVRVLDAAGCAWILIETVGVGQVEVEIVGTADTTVVVVNPGWGDTVQANKAGLMEIADIFVISKADRPGADQTRRDLEQMLDLSPAGGADERWRPPIVDTVASTGDGVDELGAAIDGHRIHLESGGRLTGLRAQRLRDELALIVAQRLRQRAEAVLDAGDRAQIESDVVARRLDPWSAVDRILGSRTD